MYFTKRKSVILFTAILIVFFSTFVVSEVTSQICEPSGFMGKFQQDSNVTLTQTCPTCTFINITVTDPNSIILFNNTAMTLSDGIFSFPPNSTISETIGTYFVQGISNLDNPFKSCYVITNITSSISTPESIIYIILTIGVFMMFAFLLAFGIGLPWRNTTNESNRVIGVEYWKYPKMGSLFLSYAFFTWFINILFIMSNNFVTLTQYSAFFLMLFNFLMAGLYALFVSMIVIFFVLAARDLKLVRLLTRGIFGK